ncbi:MAG: SRPBCC domain-containing protein [Planctomycetales bacterium]
MGRSESVDALVGPERIHEHVPRIPFQPGGMWRFTMHSPNGVDHPNDVRFLEMTRPERIVLDHLTEPHYFRVIATFEPRGNDTFLSFRMIFTSKERFDQAIKYVRPSNEQNFDRLEAQLAKLN